MKKLNNIISDWLDEHGDSEINKVVAQEAALLILEEVDEILQQLESTAKGGFGDDITICRKLLNQILYK